MAGINIIAVDIVAAAKRLATTQQSFADIFSGRRDLSKPPIDDIETYWSAGAGYAYAGALGCWFNA